MNKFIIISVPIGTAHEQHGARSVNWQVSQCLGSARVSPDDVKSTLLFFLHDHQKRTSATVGSPSRNDRHRSAVHTLPLANETHFEIVLSTYRMSHSQHRYLEPIGTA